MERHGERDRAIMAAFEAGKSIEELSEVHRLTRTRIVTILTTERHKRTVCPDPYYRSIRQS
jgi:Mor family transcriptional regulator